MRRRGVAVLLSAALLVVAACSSEDWNHRQTAARSETSSTIVASSTVPTSTTTTTSAGQERARELVYNACILNMRLFGNDDEILRVQEQELGLVAEAASRDSSWQPLYDAWVSWNADLTQRIDSTGPTVYLPPSHQLDDALATVSRGCKRSGVKFSKP